ncbi:DUF4367 domain-containing protein [Paenibacillus sp. SN-8-1]|uniref:DUF4367 domain-containing protein n=1 Tax=Paenibacillus sp. SN-8-1 TaxID=3435409 RepID=UPI003D9A3758
MRRNSPRWDPEFEDELDELIREAFITSSHTSLPTQAQRRESWLNISQLLQKDNRRRNFVRRFQWFGIIAASFALGALLVTPPMITQAVSPIYQHVQRLGTGIVQVVFGKEAYIDTSQAKTSPPPSVDAQEHAERVTSSGKIKPEVVTLEEARNNISFVLPTLPTPPARFKLDNIALFRTDKSTKTGWMEFSYSTKNGGIFRICLRKLESNQSITFLSNPDTKQIKLNNGSSAFFTGGDLPNIKFVNDSIHIQMYGNVTEEELLQAANQVK